MPCTDLDLVESILASAFVGSQGLGPKLYTTSTYSTTPHASYTAPPHISQTSARPTADTRALPSSHVLQRPLNLPDARAPDLSQQRLTFVTCASVHNFWIPTSSLGATQLSTHFSSLEIQHDMQTCNSNHPGRASDLIPRHIVSRSVRNGNTSERPDSMH